ncbi:hypothetical protein K883_05231 [Mycobacterium sp. TKK-01-0059]|nr:hypothetical protein K883_05231 [Mycobacterium sp. TKK-01-0059]
MAVPGVLKYGYVGTIPLSKGDSMDPYEQALLWTQAQLGIVVTVEERMHLVAISDHVVTDCIGKQVETLTARGGVVFWFGHAGRNAPVNRMATLNLFAAATMSAFTLPLLRGPVLITGADPRGNPSGLSGSQFQLLKSGPGANWRQRLIFRLRERRMD